MLQSSSSYQRTFDELDQVASKFWPADLSEREANLSVIPLLLSSQEQFINIIGLDVPDLASLFTIVTTSRLPPNLFLKHLVILADFGGELLKRVSREFTDLFPDFKLHYLWDGIEQIYDFRGLPKRKFNNANLHIEGKQLVQNYALDDLMMDAIALLLFGSAYAGEVEGVARILAKCEIGDFIGKPSRLSEFIKQRYIWVSRITGGATANNLGQLAQEFVAEYIEEKLEVPGVVVKRSGRLPGISHTDLVTGRETSFDLVITNDQKYVAIEVSFQVTTNSTIERKSGQAKNRFEQIDSAGHKIAYVLDGSGNFERKTALTTILEHSHCSVAFSRNELDVLCKFLKDFFL
ncbi:MAG: hypothetical protein WAU10_00490 [Caldilineaceae bacterium]